MLPARLYQLGICESKTSRGTILTDELLLRAAEFRMMSISFAPSVGSACFAPATQVLAAFLIEASGRYRITSR